VTIVLFKGLICEGTGDRIGRGLLDGGRQGGKVRGGEIRRVVPWIIDVRRRVKDVVIIVTMMMMEICQVGWMRMREEHDQ
jgi:hypothetical protein